MMPLNRGELIKNKLEFQKRTGTKVEFHSLEPESKKKNQKNKFCYPVGQNYILVSVHPKIAFFGDS